MARILGLLPSALVAARIGMGVEAWIRQVQEEGIGARTSEMRQLYRISKSIVVRSPDEPFRDISQIPRGQELAPWPVKNPHGIAQNVTIAFRDRTTGQIKQTRWGTVTPNGITREEAMATAIDAYSEHAESYNQDLIDAVHTSAYRQVPFGML